VDDLSGYSRVLVGKKQGQAAALAAWQALPAELRRIEDNPVKPIFDEVIAASPREDECNFVPTSALATLVGIDKRTKLTAAQSRQVVELTSGLSWQLAPDPQITGLPLAWNQEVALYPTATIEVTNPNISGLMRLLYLAMALAAADGVAGTEELETFHQLIAAKIERQSDWLPLKATEAALRRDTNVALRALPQMAKLIPAESRPSVLRTMARIAATNNEISLDAIKLLRRLARTFELPSDAVEALLREEAFSEVAIEGATRGTERGEEIPRRLEKHSIPFALNQDRIKALTQETHEVISLLSEVMTEESPTPIVSMPPKAETSRPCKWLDGLEPRYHSAVLHMTQHDEITTADFDHIAEEHHLMPDDLFNSVNEWADETLGDFLLERGENVRIFRNLLPDITEPDLAATA
jgi:hypothetical protein